MRPVDVVIPTLDKSQGESTGKLALISSGLDDVRLIVQHDTVRQGFTKTVNQGLRRTRPNADVCLLNDDVQRFQYGWLETLSYALNAHPAWGIVGPSGNSASVSKTGKPGGFGYKSVPMLPFWCVLIKRKVLKKAGLLHSAFIHYSSDTWYCRTVRRLGFKVVWVKSVYLWHTHQGSGLIKDWRIKDRKTLVRLGKRNGVRYSDKVPRL